MLTRGMMLGELPYLCVPMTLQAQSGVSSATLPGRRCWKELCHRSVVPDPPYPLAQSAKALSRKHPYPPFLSQPEQQWDKFLSFCKINPKFQHLRVLRKSNRRKMLNEKKIKTNTASLFF